MTFLRIAKESTPVPRGADDLVADELPHLAGWLLATNDAEFVEQDHRFGQRAFHDPWMKATIQSTGQAQLFEETLYSNRLELAGHDAGGSWEGNATELFKVLASADPATMRDHSPEWVGRMLTTLVSYNREYVSFKRAPNKRVYRLDTTQLAAFMDETEGEE